MNGTDTDILEGCKIKLVFSFFLLLQFCYFIEGTTAATKASNSNDKTALKPARDTKGLFPLDAHNKAPEVPEIPPLQICLHFIRMLTLCLSWLVIVHGSCPHIVCS